MPALADACANLLTAIAEPGHVFARGSVLRAEGCMAAMPNVAYWQPTLPR